MSVNQTIAVPTIAQLRKTKAQKEHEIEQLNTHWYSKWVFVAHISELLQKGDFVTAQVGEYPIIVARSKVDEIVLLNNSCRHRGSRVCQTERGNKNNFVCPYHQWTYDVGGQLTYAHDMMSEIECKDFQLVPFNGKIDDGKIFVQINSANTIEPISVAIDALSNQQELIFELSKEIDYIEDFNERDFLYQCFNFKAFENNDKLREKIQFNDNGCVLRFENNTMLLRALPTNRYMLEISVKCLGAIEHIVSIKDVLCEFINDNDLKWEAVSYQHDELIRQWNNEEMLEAIANIPEQNTLLKQGIEFESSFDQQNAWDSNTQRLRCSMIVSDTINVKTYTFQTDDSRWFQYKPGQFITIALPINGENEEPVLRTYTLSSSPSRPLSISITIKAQPNSIGTQWMFDNVKVGDTFKAYGPAGQFSFFNHPAEKYLFISAGSGITPMLSMTRWMFDYGNSIDINFISCVNSPDDILNKRELETIAYRCHDFRLSWVVENDPNNIWTGLRGRFNKLILGLTAPDYMTRDVYCCGPAPFMKAVREALYSSGFDMNNYHEESFAAPTPLEKNFDMEYMEDDGIAFNLTFDKSNKAIKNTQSETLLVAAKKADVAIANACGFGVCGTCKVKVESGESNMVHNGGISQKEIDNGYVLACCTKPLSDMVIKI